MTTKFELKELCLEVTNVCSMACMHCSTNSVRPSDRNPIHMPLAVTKEIVRQLKDLGGQILEISGGEPLLYPELFDLSQYAADIGLEVRLYTSGIAALKRQLLTGITKDLAEQIQKAGISKVILNLEGSRSQTHDNIVRVSGAHSMVIDGIRRIKSVGLWTGVHFVPMKPNFQEIDAVMELCLSLGVDELALLRFVPQGRGCNNRTSLELSPEQFNKFLMFVARKRSDYKGLTVRVGCPMDFLSLYDRSLKPHNCKAGKSTCSVSPDGTVVPCPAFKYSSTFTSGNVHKDSFTDLWNNGFSLLREFDYRKLTGACQTCGYLECCQGRCLAQRVGIYGDMFKGPDPACPRQKQSKDRQKLSKEYNGITALSY